MSAMSKWREVGDRVFVRRYEFFDQNIGVVLGDEGMLVVDTRTSPTQADEVIEELRELTRRPTSVVVDTHGHSDHCFGNQRFRPAPIWGHDRCVAMLKTTGERQRAALIANIPDLAQELASLVIDPPDQTFGDRATVEIDPGGRSVELRFLGRGHTDNDIVVLVEDADVLFAGDLLENDATPFFDDRARRRAGDRRRGAGSWVHRRSRLCRQADDRVPDDRRAGRPGLRRRAWPG
jgi:glyoxylase-like metal-dependent hydrolase (beta-lactamase superfamily II)